MATVKDISNHEVKPITAGEAKKETVVIVGAGIFGLSLALAWKRRRPGAHVTVLDSRTACTNPLADQDADAGHGSVGESGDVGGPMSGGASRDLNKIARADYTQPLYRALARVALDRWAHINTSELQHSQNQMYPPAAAEARVYHNSGIVYAAAQGSPGHAMLQGLRDAHDPPNRCPPLPAHAAEEIGHAPPPPQQLPQDLRPLEFSKAEPAGLVGGICEDALLGSGTRVEVPTAGVGEAGSTREFPTGLTNVLRMIPGPTSTSQAPPTCGYLQPSGGWIDAARAMRSARREAHALGIHLVEHPVSGKVVEIGTKNSSDNRAISFLVTANGTRHVADTVVIAAGNWTRDLLQQQSAAKQTGVDGAASLASAMITALQPVVLMRIPEGQCELRDKYDTARFPVWLYAIDADTLVYGFPVYGTDLIKVAVHCAGYSREMAGGQEEGRREYAESHNITMALPPRALRHIDEALRALFPELRRLPIVATRLCPYTMNFDGTGNFVIDWLHLNAGAKDRRGIAVATAGCGHAFKFFPVLGDVALTLLTGEPAPADLAAAFGGDAALAAVRAAFAVQHGPGPQAFQQLPGATMRPEPLETAGLVRIKPGQAFAKVVVELDTAQRGPPVPTAAAMANHDDTPATNSAKKSVL